MPPGPNAALKKKKIVSMNILLTVDTSQTRENPCEIRDNFYCMQFHGAIVAIIFVFRY